MVSGSLARRYARALMQIGVETNQYEKLGKEIRGLADAIIVAPELLETLSNPAFARSDRQKVLEALLRRLMASKTTTNFVMLLLDRGRVPALPAISRALDAMIDEKAGRVNATLTTPTKLSSMQVSSLRGALEKLSGKKVQLAEKQDPDILGGVIAQVGDVVYDGSLRTQLERLRQEIG